MLRRFYQPEKSKRILIAILPESVIPMPGDSLPPVPCQPNYIPFGCRSQVPGLDGDGNWAALRLEASLADLLATNSCSGTLMPKINGLWLLDTLVSHVLGSFSTNTGFSDGLFVMTTAPDHKNNLNRSTIQKKFPGTLRVKTIANSAGLHLSAVAEAEDGRNLYPSTFGEIILFASPADHSFRHIRLPSVRPAQCAHWKGSATTGPTEKQPPPGILFFDAWRVEPPWTPWIFLPTFPVRKMHLKKTPRLCL